MARSKGETKPLNFIVLVKKQVLKGIAPPSPNTIAQASVVLCQKVAHPSDVFRFGLSTNTYYTEIRKLN